MLFRQVPRPPDVVVVAHTVQKLLADQPLFAQVDFIVVRWAVLGPAFFTQLHVIETGTGAGRVDMQFSDRERLISAGSKSVCNRWHGGQRQLGLKAAVAVRAWRGAREQGSARRNADGAFRVRSWKPYATAGQLIQRGRLHRGMAGCAKQMARPVVSGNQQNIGLVVHEQLSI